MLMVGAGYLAAPMLSGMIPWQPASMVGEYMKRAAVVVVGSQLLQKAVGRKYGNALFAGGMISIAVDVLRSYVPAFAGAPMMGTGGPETAGPEGMGYYFPPNAELAAMYGGDNGSSALAMAMGTGESVGRFATRF